LLFFFVELVEVKTEHEIF